MATTISVAIVGRAITVWGRLIKKKKTLFNLKTDRKK